jgi:hypothetical protein
MDIWVWFERIFTDRYALSEYKEKSMLALHDK